MSDAIDRMKSGDRDALLELLSRHGAAIEHLRAVITRGADVAPSPTDIAVGLWESAIFAAPEVDERRWALTITAERSSEGLHLHRDDYTQLDLPTLGRLAARVALGLADSVDAQMLEESRRRPEAARFVARIDRGLDSAHAQSPEAGPFEGLWPEISRRLR